MRRSLSREFKLGGPSGDGLHPYLNERGAYLGRGTPLLERDASGHWHPVARDRLERILSTGYGVRIDLGGRMGSLAAVARALNKGDRSLAAIALVQAEFPPLPNQRAAFRMARVDGYARYNPDQPRVPAGQSDGGEWESEDISAADIAGLTATPIDDSSTKPLAPGAKMPRDHSLSEEGKRFIKEHEQEKHPPCTPIWTRLGIRQSDGATNWGKTNLIQTASRGRRPTSFLMRTQRSLKRP